jgi:hypothetical protein
MTRWGSVGVVAVVLFALGLCLALPSAGRAAEWSTIVPGASTMESVRARFGAATRTSVQKQDGYDVAEWLYEGPAAPVGFTKLTVEFGLLTSLGFRADVVRDFMLSPKPGIFTRGTVIGGWGLPDRVGRDGEADVFLYQHGLVVYFGKDGWEAQLMVFTPPQPQGGEPAARPRP